MTQNTAAAHTAIVNTIGEPEIWIDGEYRIPLPTTFRTWDTSHHLMGHNWQPVKGAHLREVGPGQYAIAVERHQGA